MKKVKVTLTQTQLEEARRSLLNYKSEAVKFNAMLQASEALARLEDNADFNFLFNETYFKEEALRNVMLLSEKSLLTEDKRTKLTDILVSIATVKDWLDGLRANKSMFESNAKTLDGNVAEVTSAISSGFIMVDEATAPEGE